MKVALVYDRVNKWGGAERVLLALHKLFPDAPLYTSVYHPKTAPWAHVFRITTTFLQHIPFASTNHEWLAPLMPVAFEDLTFDQYDLVISVTSEAAKGIITKPKTLHICYLLTPTRYLWSGYDEYFPHAWSRLLFYPIIFYLRKWDQMAATHPDVLISISKEVQKRVESYYKRKSEVIYPPVTIASNSMLDKKNKGVNDSSYFLIVSRLVSYKRIDLAIEACNELELPLKIIGSGIELERLKGMAGSTVEFLGSLTDQEVERYYRNCKAFLFPGREDFGLTVVEAQMFGKPVIAYKAGGALETIIEGKTGLFFTPQTKVALKKTLMEFETYTFNESESRKQAKMFSPQLFEKKLMDIIKQNLQS